MISPHTPPGTKVICIDDDTANQWRHVKPEYHAWLPIYINRTEQHGAGDVLTVLSVQAEEAAVTGFSVSFEEENGRFPLECYRLLELPRSILQCLEVNPADIAKHKERSKVRERLYAVMRKAGV